MPDEANKRANVPIKGILRSLACVTCPRHQECATGGLSCDDRLAESEVALRASAEDVVRG